MRDSFTDIVSAVQEAFAPTPPGRLGVAVSGGGDSVALLHILRSCLDPGDVRLHAVTVDHGLRPEARNEAIRVAEACEAMGIPHATLRWSGWDGKGNLQGRARQARYEMLTNWAHSNDISDIALGHTADDQAETFLMRLSRSSGVDGLSAMAARRVMNGITLVRPMLGVGRKRLRAYLRDGNISWIDDPGNDDPGFSRIKARNALAALEPLGISVRSLNDVARNMERAREALDCYSFLAARDFVHVNAGDILVEHRRLRVLPREIVRRLLSRAIAWISGRGYVPRRTALSNFAEAAQDRRVATLGGCQLLHHGPYVWVCREFNAVRREACAAPGLWDHRWHVSGGHEAERARFNRALPQCGTRPAVQTLPRHTLEARECNQTGHASDAHEIRALGQKGLMQCDAWRSTGRPHAALLSSPAIWKDGKLVAAPLAGHPENWRAEVVGGSEEFYAGLLSH